MDSADRSSYLLDAVVHGHYRQVKFYLDAGYDKDYIDNDREGSTPLILAVTLVNDNVIRHRLIVLLLQAGANPNLGDKHGLTPFMHSILLRQNRSVRLFLESKRLEHDTEDFEGNTALMHAASLGLTDVAIMILERLSTLHRMIYLGRKNRIGLTAFDLAENSGNKELAGLLLLKNSYFFPIIAIEFADINQLEHRKPTTSFVRREEVEKTKNDIQQTLLTRNTETNWWKF